MIATEKAITLLNGITLHYLNQRKSNYKEFKMSLTKVSYSMISGSPLNVLDYGAIGNGIADDTAALQLAVNAAMSQNKRLYIPKGEYLVSGTITVTNGSGAGLFMYGDTTSNFLVFPSGSTIKYTGTSTLFQLNGNASTINAMIKNITFKGNASAITAIKINAGWFTTIEECVFQEFLGVGAAAVYLTYTTGSFVGVTKIINSEFAGNVTHIYFDKPDTNVLIIDMCSFYDHTFGILNGDGINGIASRNVNITNCLFESVDADYDIFCYGGAQGWNIVNNYFEQNDNTVNSPRILFGSGMVYPLNQSITITGNIFSKELGSAASSLISVAGCNGLTVKSNWNGFPASGSVNDRYSVIATGTTNYTIEPFNAVSGATPYPANINASTIYAGFDVFTGSKLYFGNLQLPGIASANPNTLDTYEKGTWSPTNQYVTLTVNEVGNYTRIGQLVTASFDVTFPVNANGNLAELVGLPYVIGSGAAENVSVTFSDYGALLYMYTTFASGANFYDASGVALTNANLSGKRVVGVFVYNA